MNDALGPAKFAYVVVAVTRKHDPALDVTHAPAAPVIGDIVVFSEDMGRAEYIREDDHGPIVDIVHLHFLAIGRQADDGNVEFSYEAQRLLALIQIGAHNERVAHQLVDQVFEKFDQFLSEHTREPEVEYLEQLRKGFV